MDVTTSHRIVKSNKFDQGRCVFDTSNQSYIKWENVEIKYDLKEPKIIELQ